MRHGGFTAGTAELGEIELHPRPRQTQPVCCLAKALAQQFSPHATAGHALPELAVVVSAAAHLADAGHHPRGALGKVLLQPLLKQRVHFPGQADDDAEGRAGASLGSGFQDVFELRFVQEWDHR